MPKLEFTIKASKLKPNEFGEHKFYIAWNDDDVTITIDDQLIMQKGEQL